MWKIEMEHLSTSDRVDAKSLFPLPDVDSSFLHLGRDSGPGFHDLACHNAEGTQRAVFVDITLKSKT